MIGRMIKVLAVIVLSVYIFATLFNLKSKEIIGLAAAICTVIYFKYKKRFSKRFWNHIYEECDSATALEMYGTLISHANDRHQLVWEMSFYNLANILFYDGRIEDARNVQSLLKVHSSGTISDLCCEIIGARIALYELDRKKLETHCANIRFILIRKTVDKSLRRAAQKRLMSLTFLCMWEEGEYEQLYGQLKNAISFDKKMITEVERNYYLYKVAFAMGNSEKMKEHKVFVCENGGTLWYRNAIESIYVQ